jgi:hypothetical protein
MLCRGTDSFGITSRELQIQLIHSAAILSALLA